MPDYATGVLALIDARVDHARPIVTKMGTVQSRDTTGARAMVAFDGSSGVAQPVKCFESVLVDGGDRVGLVKFESDWVIVGNYTLHALGSSAMSLQFAGSTTTASASYSDMPGSPALAVTKWRDTTQLRLRVILSAMAITTAGTVLKVAFRVLSGDGTVDYDQDVARFDYSSINIHGTLGGFATTTGALPAGNYTLTGRWLKFSGAGSIQIDGQDFIHMEAEEVLQ